MPLPKGYVLDQPKNQPRVPAGYVLDTPGQAQPQSGGFSGFLRDAARASVTGPALPIGGAMTGAAALAPLGAPAGPLGMMATGAIGAGLGAFGAEGIRRGAGQAAGVLPTASAGENMEAMGRAGGNYAAGELLGQAITPAMAAGAGKVLESEILPAWVHAFTGVPMKRTQFMAANPEAVATARTAQEVGAAQDAMEQANQLIGLKKMIENRAQSFSASELENMVLTTANKVRAGQAVDPQELYAASQAAAHLQRMAKYGEPTAKSAIEAGAVTSGKGAVDAAAESAIPGYADQRLAYAAAKTKEAFSSLFPQKQNLSPNVLRTVGPIAAAAGGLMSGEAGPLMMLPAFSPMTYSALIRTLGAMARAGAPEAAISGSITGAQMNR